MRKGVELSAPHSISTSQPSQKPAGRNGNSQACQLPLEICRTDRPCIQTTLVDRYERDTGDNSSRPHQAAYTPTSSPLWAAGPSPWVTCQVFANISFKPKVLPGFPQTQLSPSFPDFFLLDYGICKSPLVLLPPNQAPDLFPALVSRHLLFLEVN